MIEIFSYLRNSRTVQNNQNNVILKSNIWRLRWFCFIVAFFFGGGVSNVMYLINLLTFYDSSTTFYRKNVNIYTHKLTTRVMYFLCAMSLTSSEYSLQLSLYILVYRRLVVHAYETPRAFHRNISRKLIFRNTSSLSQNHIFLWSHFSIHLVTK